MTYADIRHWYEEPDDPDEPNGHCYGTNTRGCGRFVTAGAFHCARCLAEFEDECQQQIADEQRIAQAIESSETPF